MKAFAGIPGAALGVVVAAAIPLSSNAVYSVPGTGNGTAVILQAAGEDAAVTNDPEVTVTIGAETSDPNEIAGLPDASTWVTGEAELAQPTSEHCEPSTRYKLNNLKNKFNVDWADSVTNKLDVPVQYTLTAQKSTQFKWHVDVKVSTSENVLLFAKLEAEINAGVEKSKTTTYGSQVTTTVKPHKTIFGDRGMFMELAGFTRTITYSNCHQKVLTGKVEAPYRQNWKLYYA